MATFKYTAFDENEKNLKGFINASDSDEARLILINRGLNPLNIEKTLQKRSKVRISNNNLSIFTKQMSALLSAGTPIEKCLVLLSKQSSNSKFSQILLSINEDITEGNSLSSSMKKYPSIFDEIYTSTIYAGETSASLSEVFHDLSIYLDKEAKIRSQVVGALIYPAVLFFVSIAVIYALLSFVLPQVVEQFVSSNVELPLLTQTLLAFSEVFPIIIVTTHSITISAVAQPINTPIVIPKILIFKTLISKSFPALGDEGVVSTKVSSELESTSSCCSCIFFCNGFC